MLKKQETGRSMVEMLGVLAVIGVLSVAGIAGYTTAMNKHRANELLNEASKRAVVIVPQIAMGNTPSIAEFTNNDLGYGTFVSTIYGEDGTTAWTSTDKKFTLSITGVSEAVCNQMKNIAGGVIKDFKPDTCASGNGNNVKLTYNNDMSTGDVENPGGGGTSNPSDYDGDETGCKADNSRQYCASNDTCISATDTCPSTDNCPTGTTVDPNYTGTDALGDGKCICNDYSTAQCGLGYYCKFGNATGCTDSGRGTGKCTEITSSETSNNYSSGPMDWWSAYSFCKGLDSTMVTGRTGSSVQCGTLSYYGCCTQPTSSPDYYWLDTCTDNDSIACVSSSCYTFDVDYGCVDYRERDSGGFYALCE